MEDAGVGVTCVYTPQRPRRRPAARWAKTFTRFLFEEPRCLAQPALDFVATTNACASLLTKTLGVDRSNPCGPLSRNYACVSLGNVATCLLAKTRRRSPTNPPRTPGPSNDLPASGALAAMDNVGSDPGLSSAPRDQKFAKLSGAFTGQVPYFFDRALAARGAGPSLHRERGCIAVRMQMELHHGLLELSRVRREPCARWC